MPYLSGIRKCEGGVAGMLLYYLQVECVIISLTTLQYFLMTTVFIAEKYGFVSLMNKNCSHCWLQ